MSENPIADKSYNFALNIVEFYKQSMEGKYDKPLSKQLLRSGTSIGADISEAQDAQSAADFKSKMSIALKEARESEYWIHLLHDSHFMSEDIFINLQPAIKEIIRILTAIVKNTK